MTASRTNAVPARRTAFRGVVIVEDEVDIGELLRQHIAPMAERVVVAHTCAEARVRLAVDRVELAILDLNLPDGDGLDLCRELRRRTPQPLIILLTARTEEAARLRGFDEGADDYLCKPFSVRELMARITALVRRSSRTDQPMPRSERLIVRDLELNPELRTVTRGDQPVDLSPREFDLLWFLARHVDRVYSREQLLAAVWGARFEGYDHTVNAHINRVRTKLDPNRTKVPYIATVWGSGYRFVAHPAPASATP